MGVNVNAVAPGFVDTDMTQGLTDEQRQQIVRRSALRRLADIDDVANAVEFLLSDKSEKHHRHGAYRRRREYGMTANLHRETRRAATAQRPKPGCARSS